MARVAALCAGLCWAGGAAALSAPPDPASLVRAELVSQLEGAAPGQAAQLGLRLRHAPHWHTYWAMPGDAGLPTRINWKLDAGYVARPLQWPVPQLLRVGDLANYGYEGDVLFPVSVQVPASAPLGSRAHFAAHVDWLVCNELCIPGGADLALDLPVVAQPRPGPEADAIAAARALVPPSLALDSPRARLADRHVTLEYTAGAQAPRRLEFFSSDAGRIEAAAPQVLHVQGRRVRLELRAADPVEDGFKSLSGVLVGDGGPADGGWAGVIDVPLAAARAADAAPAHPGPGAAPAAAASAPAGAPPAPPAPASAAGTAAIASAPAAGADAIAVLVALAGAFLGGMILNLMPCVFPVLSLKLMGLVRHRNVAPAQLRAHGAVYAAGVVLSFLALAGAVIGLRAAGTQIGWGFQLQSPAFIAGLIALFFLIGLNLLGAFEFTLASGVIARVADGAAPAQEESWGASFATGVLAAAVAAPCTAPFMGAAVGFAATQAAPLAMLVFLFLGAGMAAPYLALTLVPAWVRHLPRPGVWMERLKQAMAFPMFLTCAWLFWVLGQQIEMDAVAALLAALVALGLFAWSIGLAQRGAPRWRWLAGGALVAALLLAAPSLRLVAAPVGALTGASAAAAPSPAAGPDDWSRWSPGVQGQALTQGRPVFVDFTAAWCITCQANKRLVLHDDRVIAAFRAHGVVRLVADWTRRDDAISGELARLQRSGVPVYVLYDRNGGQHVLPEILSTQGMLEALAGL
jgi:thiol:disulfide interchange protein DsbD